MHDQPRGQSAVLAQVTSGTHVRVPRLQTEPAPHSASPRHGMLEQVPATQRSPLAQSVSVAHVGTTWQLPSTQREPAAQSASREQAPTNTQLPLTHAHRDGQSASPPHIPVGTQRPPTHSTPLAAQSAVIVHSGGGTQRPSSQICVGGHVSVAGQRAGRSQ